MPGKTYPCQHMSDGAFGSDKHTTVVCWVTGWCIPRCFAEREAAFQPRALGVHTRSNCDINRSSCGILVIEELVWLHRGTVWVKNCHLDFVWRHNETFKVAQSRLVLILAEMIRRCSLDTLPRYTIRPVHFFAAAFIVGQHTLPLRGSMQFDMLCKRQFDMQKN